MCHSWGLRLDLHSLPFFVFGLDENPPPPHILLDVTIKVANTESARALQRYAFDVVEDREIKQRGYCQTRTTVPVRCCRPRVIYFYKLRVITNLPPAFSNLYERLLINYHNLK